MIFVAAGTQDGRELVDRLLAQDYPVATSVVESLWLHAAGSIPAQPAVD